VHAEAVRLALAGVMAVAAIELRELRRIDALRAHRSQANDVGEIRRVLNWKPSKSNRNRFRPNCAHSSRPTPPWIVMGLEFNLHPAL
jgi:hypothetical protein